MIVFIMFIIHCLLGGWIISIWGVHLYSKFEEYSIDLTFSFFSLILQAKSLLKLLLNELKLNIFRWLPLILILEDIIPCELLSSHNTCVCLAISDSKKKLAHPLNYNHFFWIPIFELHWICLRLNKKQVSEIDDR